MSLLATPKQKADHLMGIESILNCRFLYTCCHKKSISHNHAWRMKAPQQFSIYGRITVFAMPFATDGDAIKREKS